MTYNAVIIIIGDEILKGLTRDTNSVFLCQELRKMGYAVKKVSVIEDKVDVIAKEVRQAAAAHSVVITSGGLGPTHDDVTMEGIAKAFSEELVTHDAIKTILKSHYQTDTLLETHMKMARIPKSAELHWFEDKIFPLLKVHNVYIYPGVPKYLKKSFMLAKETGFLQTRGHRFHLCKVIFAADEIGLAPMLTNLQEQFRSRSLSVGSYPLDDDSDAQRQVKVTLESVEEKAVREAHQILTDELSDFIIETEFEDATTSVDGHLPHGHIINCSSCHSLVDQVYDECESSSRMSQCLKQALDVLESAFTQYEPSQMCLSFNGGKDCTVLLHLYWAALQKRWKFKETPVLLYIAVGNSFPVMDEFAGITSSRYGCSLIRKDCGSAKLGLIDLAVSHPHIKAIVMGTRRGDPRADSLDHFSMTDSDWPQYMRICPILEWQYSDVWLVLRHIHIPYCSLYDQGYTSVGSIHNTQPNPALKGDVPGHYHPAYMLSDGSLERAGRV